MALKAQYEELADPTAAWLAYQMARRYGMTLPAWVLEYFDRVAQDLVLTRGHATSGAQLAARVLKALELARPGPSLEARRHTAARDLILAGQVHRLLSTGACQQVKAAIFTIAERTGEREGIVRRAYRMAQARGEVPKRAKSHP
jgi:hypothetical protein